MKMTLNDESKDEGACVRGENENDKRQILKMLLYSVHH
jgi:hypothetical protein